ncbi:MAG: flavin reductase [Nevskia sp.]|nr:flavin reductase [Nevskia sp.]
MTQKQSIDQAPGSGVRETCPAGDFRTAMQKLAGSVCVVTSAHEGKRLGLTMTAVCSLSADPPSLVACVNRSAEAHDMIIASGRLCVNVLKYHHVPLSVSFSAGDGSKGEVRFTTADWGVGVTGSPVLADALAYFDCWVVEYMQAKTHTVFMCNVASAGTSQSGTALIYANRQYGRLAADEESKK